MASKRPQIDHSHYGVILIDTVENPGHDFEYEIPGDWSMEKAVKSAMAWFAEDYPNLHVLSFNDHWYL